MTAFIIGSIAILALIFAGSFYEVTFKKTSMHDIFKEVELVFTNDKVLSRNVKMYLCQRYTGKTLKEIGFHFGIGESGVSQACRRVAHKIEKDKKLKKKIERLEKLINL